MINRRTLSRKGIKFKRINLNDALFNCKRECDLNYPFNKDKRQACKAKCEEIFYTAPVSYSPDALILETQRIAAEQLAAEQLAAEQLAAQKLAAEQLAAQKLAAEQLAAQKLAAEQSAASQPTTTTTTTTTTPPPMTTDNKKMYIMLGVLGLGAYFYFKKDKKRK